ncbi:MAG: cob(I)yrinic acid a,c-diamide adenosyltransferase [Nitrososphaerota archaeon]|jgi:cob(I)alamin adenosyltransferase|nr:cob(I)yrinic acid a,c-diamide adenosyltransferase [Nitrososphaerota archaeon]MDG6931334.1 cob(I)yrinic acid a,c-diamide adenosyltransferase [Nitrososphaerota archaeon]
MEVGLVEVYTGNGKGKTTAAVGLAVRAAGWGLKVALVHFMKVGGYGESKILKKQSNITERFYGMNYFITTNKGISGLPVVVYEPGKPPIDYVAKVMRGLKWARRALVSGRFDMVVLDELATAVHMGLIGESYVLDMLKERPRGVEIVITGRYATQAMIDAADLVTEMKEIKHPYGNGLAARKGIEF